MEIEDFFLYFEIYVHRYKPIIVLSACLGIIMWSLMLWTKAYAWLMVVQLFYGTYMAAEVAYYTYMYAKVDRKDYQKVTSHTRAAITGGKFLSGVTAQILISYNLLNVRELNYISFASECLVKIVSSKNFLTQYHSILQHKLFHCSLLYYCHL